MPASCEQVVEPFSSADFGWWISGGVALELHVGLCPWREHDDTDVGVMRADVPKLRAPLAGWELWIASQG